MPSIPTLPRPGNLAGTESLVAGMVSVVVPVYNSSENLPELLERLEPALARSGRAFEAILVDDGSRDDSWDTLARLAEGRPWLRGLRLNRNYGQHNALLCGIREARGEFVVTMDDDLQNPPEEIPKLLERFVGGADVVYGVPEREQHGVWRDLASRITKAALQGIMGAEIARNVSAFRAFRTHLREAFGTYRGPFVSIDVLLTWSTRRFEAVRVDHRPRSRGRSQYTLRRLVLHALNMVTGFSSWPLHVASIVGFAFTIFGFVVLGFVLLRFVLEGRQVPGFVFLASIISIFSGAQLFSLGMLGEYLARIHFRTLDQPAYFVGERTPAP